MRKIGCETGGLRARYELAGNLARAAEMGKAGRRRALLEFLEQRCVDRTEILYRSALAWNPLLHAIDWFRAGFFQGYQPHWLDQSYLVVLAILAPLAGFALERGLRRRLSAEL